MTSSDRPEGDPGPGITGSCGLAGWLLAVPNVSEGRDAELIAALVEAAGSPADVRLLDRHTDPDHHRTVLTLASRTPGALAESLVRLAAAAAERIDLTEHDGLHPRVGALDVAPIVHPHRTDRGAACAEALLLANRLAEEAEHITPDGAGLPVLLYGALSPENRTRADLRRGGPDALARRIEAGELRPDFGPAAPHPTAGAVLVTARPPLAAFNLELAASVPLTEARRVAALLREGGHEGLPGVRAIALALPRRDVVQLSFNVEDHAAVPLARLVAAVARHLPVERAEQVGLVPAAAYDGYPEDVPTAHRRTLEDALRPEAPPSL